MTVRQDDRHGKNFSEGSHPPPPLLTTRSLVLLLCAGVAGLAAIVWPAAAIGIGVAVAVLTLLHVVVGE